MLLGSKLVYIYIYIYIYYIYIYIYIFQWQYCDISPGTGIASPGDAVDLQMVNYGSDMFFIAEVAADISSIISPLIITLLHCISRTASNQMNLVKWLM